LSSPTLGGSSPFSFTKPLTQTINPVNDAPVISGFGPPAANTEQITSLLDSDTNATLVDPELSALGIGSPGNWAGATLTVARSGGANAEDLFGIDASVGTALFTVSGNQLQFSGLTFATFTSSGGTLTINFTSSGTPATNNLVNKVIERITYKNTSDAPPASVQIDLNINDGNTGSQGPGRAPSSTTTPA